MVVRSATASACVVAYADARLANGVGTAADATFKTESARLGIAVPVHAPAIAARFAELAYPAAGAAVTKIRAGNHAPPAAAAYEAW